MGDSDKLDQLAPHRAGRRKRRCLEDGSIGRPRAEHLQPLARIKPGADLGRGAIDRVKLVGKVAGAGRADRAALPVLDQHLAPAAIILVQGVNAGKAGNLGIPVKGAEGARDPESHAPRLLHQRQKLGDRQGAGQIAAAPLLQFRERRIGTQQPVTRIGEAVSA